MSVLGAVSPAVAGMFGVLLLEFPLAPPTPPPPAAVVATSPFSSAKLEEGETTGCSGTKLRLEDMGRLSSFSRCFERAAWTAAALAPTQ